MSIKLINQPTEDTCTSACISMITGLDISDVIDQFHDKWIKHQTNPYMYLKEKGFKFFVNDNPFYHNMTWGNIYLLTVPSLNIEGGLHHIVADMTGDSEVILDPNNGKDGKKFYVEWVREEIPSFAVKINSWLVDGYTRS